MHLILSIQISVSVCETLLVAAVHTESLSSTKVELYPERATRNSTAVTFSKHETHWRSPLAKALVDYQGHLPSVVRNVVRQHRRACYVDFREMPDIRE